MLKKYQVILICLALAAATIVVYEPARHNGFVGFDDNWYVYNNNYIKNGLTRDSIAWAFSFTNQVGQTGNWHPLTSLSHILDVEFFGLEPAGHHFTSIGLHAVNAVLLFLVLQYMTSKPGRSAIVAALFALHPLHVESVAWVSERKDVLSMLFWLLTMLSYAWYARRPNISRYMVTLICFTLGLMAKPMVVTLPFVMLLLDFWPLNRFTAEHAKFLAESRLSEAETAEKKNEINSACFAVSAVRVWGRLIFEKIPFFVLSAVVCVITQIAQQSTWAVAAQENLPLKARLLNVPLSYVTYIEKMFWPTNLAVFYPHRGLDTPLWLAVMSVVLLVVLTVIALYFWRTRKYPLMGWFWFIGTLIPVIGFVQVGRQAMADRYTYIPLTGLFIIVVWGICDLLKTVPFRKIILSLSAVAVLLPLSILTWRQEGFWRDDIALYKRATEVVSDNWWAEQLLGNAFAKQGRYEDAANSYKESLKILPGSFEIINDLGYALLQQNKLDEVIDLYQKTLPELPNTGDDPLSIIPNTVTPPKPESGKMYAIIRCYTEAHFNLGEALSRQERDDEAIKHYAEAIRIRPDYLIARQALAKSLIMQGRADFAIEQLEKCLLLAPDSIEIRATLATVLLSQNRTDESILQASEIMQLQPDSPMGFYMLARVYQKQGKTADANEAFGKAAELAQKAGQEELAKKIQEQVNTLKSK
jgi:protein O-mannosyl-transferase